MLSPADLGEFSLRPQQGDVRAAFVPLSRLQQDLDVRDRVNALLVSSVPGAGIGDGRSNRCCGSARPSKTSASDCAS